MLVVAFVVLLCSLLSATAQQFVADTDSVSPVVSSALDDLPPAIYHYTRVLGGLDGRLLSPTLVQGPDGALLSLPCASPLHGLKVLTHRTLIRPSTYTRVFEGR